MFGGSAIAPTPCCIPRPAPMTPTAISKTVLEGIVRIGAELVLRVGLRRRSFTTYRWDAGNRLTQIADSLTGTSCRRGASSICSRPRPSSPAFRRLCQRGEIQGTTFGGAGGVIEAEGAGHILMRLDELNPSGSASSPTRRPIHGDGAGPSLVAPQKPFLRSSLFLSASLDCQSRRA